MIEQHSWRKSGKFSKIKLFYFILLICVFYQSKSLECQFVQFKESLEAVVFDKTTRK